MLLRDLVGFLAVAGAVWGFEAGVPAMTDTSQNSMWIIALVALCTSASGALIMTNRVSLPRTDHRRFGPNASHDRVVLQSEQLSYFISFFEVQNNLSVLQVAVVNPYRKRRQIIYIVTGSLVFGLSLYIVKTFIEDDNFRVVDTELYRAGQLRSDEWQESYEEHPYQSVLNLRGAALNQSWYVLEQNFSAEHRLAHYDFALSANVAPNLVQMEMLVDLIRAAPKPLLIHCKEGADRSGLVSALYLYAIKGARPDKAGRQLSLWYGHFPWLMSRTGAMDEAFRHFVIAHPAL